MILSNTLLLKLNGNLVPEKQEQRCVRLQCNQLISGRQLRYGRVLAIIHREEYLKEVSIIIFA